LTLIVSMLEWMIEMFDSIVSTFPWSIEMFDSYCIDDRDV
jgi:hypothetical protein